MTYRVGIDIGGTFTDFALLHDDEIILEKVLPLDVGRALVQDSRIYKSRELELVWVADTGDRYG